MFAEHTRASIIALASIDGGVTKKERNNLIAILNGTSASTRILRYREAAERLNLSLASVKQLARLGKLKRVRGLGKRACGLSEESVIQFSNQE